jgi:hypothetical protein
MRFMMARTMKSCRVSGGSHFRLTLLICSLSFGSILRFIVTRERTIFGLFTLLSVHLKMNYCQEPIWWYYRCMKPTHPVELLACAIATQEGYFGAATNTPVVRNNPGDLRYEGQTGVEPRQVYTEIAAFRSKEFGTTALFRQVWLQVAQGQTVRQIIRQWAPPNENNTSVYLENVLAWTGLPADVPVLDLLPPLVKLN